MLYIEKEIYLPVLVDLDTKKLGFGSSATMAGFNQYVSQSLALAKTTKDLSWFNTDFTKFSIKQHKRKPKHKIVHHNIKKFYSDKTGIDYHSCKTYVKTKVILAIDENQIIADDKKANLNLAFKDCKPMLDVSLQKNHSLLTRTENEINSLNDDLTNMQAKKNVIMKCLAYTNLNSNILSDKEKATINKIFESDLI